ncbi:unnamed protein product, partial [Strongylus vulgaris]
MNGSHNSRDKFLFSFSDEIGSADDDQADMSLLTGRIRTGANPNSEEAKNSGEILPYEKGDYFQFRSWRGLDADV